ncbi:MAG: hypothetical protein JXA89_06030 [Anaerolineae bacterium]|nr:hypothetical protein [Anaerolineae bacterium]
MPDPSRLVVDLTEYAKCSEPIRLRREVAQTIRTRLGSFVDIEPAWETPGTFWLTAKQYVGDILVDDVHIRIRSAKAPMVNLFWMLTFAYDLPKFRDRTVEYQEQDSLFEFLVTILVQQVERLIRRGLYSSYHTRHDNQPHLRGKLDMTRQLRQNQVHPERFAIRWSDHTRDVLENRLLKHVLLRLASVRYPHQQKLSSRLRKAFAAFDGVAYLAVTLRDFDEVKYTRLNQHYRGSLALARLLWQHLSLRNESGTVPFATYLFDLNVLFERFIAAYLRESLSGSALQVKHKYGAMLDRERTERVEMDVVLLQDVRPVLVLDTKYKTYKGKPARDDLTQVFAYCHTLHVEQGVLLYPDTDRISDRRSMTGVRIDMRGVSLKGSPAQVEKELCRLIDELVAMAAS